MKNLKRIVENSTAVTTGQSDGTALSAFRERHFPVGGKDRTGVTPTLPRGGGEASGLLRFRHDFPPGYSPTREEEGASVASLFIRPLAMTASMVDGERWLATSARPCPGSTSRPTRGRSGAWSGSPTASPRVGPSRGAASASSCASRAGGWAMRCRSTVDDDQRARSSTRPRRSASARWCPGDREVARVSRRSGVARARRRPARPAARPGRADRGRGVSSDRTPAPAIIDRALVEQPVATGVLVVDALFALGRGQRRADHRRPCDRQDRDRGRHDHQPEALPT